jgi:arylsulfatase A-like enzyme
MRLPRREALKRLAGGASVLSAQTSAQPRKRPNILYLHSHDTGRYIQPYGFAVPTPNLQRLASEGVLFRQAYDAAPTCSPSRAALLTGQCAHSSGMLGLAHLGFGLHDYRQHILHVLRAADYRSTLAGLQHIARDPKVIGFDEILPTRDKHVAEVAPAAARFLKNAPKEPFFLDVGFTETHREFPPPGPREDVRWTTPPAPLPDTARVRRDMAAFHASARVLDEGMGQVLSALESSGLAPNTLVICTTDHGIAFPAMKCNLTQHGTGVFLILRGPGGFSGGGASDALVSQIDVFPTICDLIEVARPEWLQGRSMLPLARGEKPEIRDELCAEVTFHAAYEPQRGVRTKQWNYYRRFGDRRLPVLSNCDDGLSKDEWMERGWGKRNNEAEYLFDLTFDPNENRNMAADPAARAVLADMRARLDRWMRETRDPLLDGPVQAPPGALVGNPNSISPKELTRTVG